MNKFLLSAVAAVAFAGPAFAADMPVKAVKAPAYVSPWDIAFGSAIMTDYIFRGVSQSAKHPSVAAYFEPRYNINPNLQLYVGVSGESIDFANRASAEIDFYGGVRPTFGPLALDFGIFYYSYPGGTCFGGQFPQPTCMPALPNGNAAKDSASFYELYAKATYTIIDPLAVGANFYYSPNFLNTGAEGEYLSGTVKYTAPSNMAFWNGNIGWYASGEFGRQWLGTSDPFYGIAGTAFTGGIPYKDYNTWNVGIGFTYKVFTLDLRYSDTNLNQGDCNAFTSDFSAPVNGSFTAINPLGVGSRWCGSTFVAKLSADLTVVTNLK